jgi:mono/diheme cytochrome c family protein
MKTSTLIAAAVLAASAAGAAQAYEADWKRGRVYYRQICTSCHMAQAKKTIAPNERAKSDWTSYMQADKHNKGKDTVKQYFSKPYRASIKASNQAAAKFADVPDQDLIEDVKAFLQKGAKDGDAPAGCS